ncbi:DUF2637 domain-containing protein [Actinomadura algeriensis]|uniref:DUF2637 domain-containing protein n=1 Tax=Actinomadura algeriensis TaxID=1679523 RepID=A0ABR9JT00_9ACTN|nr:DUF2637 domain-containing protein [Actinomadura algeriensis]MBE1533250.1 hypothetical protein [Actinomadura algeriensis]
MTDRLIRLTTALAVVAVAAVAAVISYSHAFELVRAHGETGATARLVPLTVDGLIWAASMVILDASRRQRPIPALAEWSLAVGIVATVGANVAHGAAHGLIGALVSAWPALALVGSFELLMTLTRTASSRQAAASGGHRTEPEPPGPSRTEAEQPLEQLVLAEYQANLHGPGRPVSQRQLAEKHGIDRRRVKKIIADARPGPPA